ncbi:ATP-dependent Clp protease ATP-binding subunit [bacterium]|jgi:ATP-dependent Clp protease ATP-binding subunit ClpC|nr:ATP-dependent Clp protease ATP-binding subunit [bacterium]MBT4552387.1 ATP-dependent Clp protease ATP-binding subunit [bacterium]MBT5988830.1 ATP-dependent Clp protease ATP-binding subunit [bacterium]MBT7087591.1 ATP-dependent Clp protease ATP-binding subunit [bacterium]
MFSRFTEKAIHSIMLAQEAAKKFHHNYVGTEHILLGILEEGDNMVVKALAQTSIAPEQIKMAIEEKLDYGSLSSDYKNTPFTQEAKQVLSYAWEEARKLGHNYVNIEHLFLALFKDQTNVAARIINELGLNIQDFRAQLFELLGNKVEEHAQYENMQPTPTLDLYGRDLTRLAREDKLDPIIGREEEIKRIIQILCRRTKNNPVLTGEAGVGKTAIAEGLAQYVAQQKVPEKLLHKRIVNLDLGLLVAGTKYRGEFEDRVKKVMEEVNKAENVIIFMDELHTIIGTGGSEGSMDAANLFKPALARGELQCIGATTLDEYRKYIEGDAALERRFQSVFVAEPSIEETYEILKGIKDRYEEFHKVVITDDALLEAVNYAVRYITDRHLPDKAIDLIDEGASKVMLMASGYFGNLEEETKKLAVVKAELKEAKKNKILKKIDVLSEKIKKLKEKIKELKIEAAHGKAKIVDASIIADIVAHWTGVPVKKISEEESSKLLKMAKQIEDKVIGQNEAVDALVKAVKRSKAGLKDPKRPTGSFLFLGPTGVGKSELAKRLAEYLFGNREAIVTIDMSEYMEKHTVSRLIGSPPGYVGFGEGGQLTEPVRRRPYSVVLFDEMEKASPEIVNVLLQILDDGRLTDATGRTVNFKNTIIIMTSNVGAHYIEKETSFGFLQNRDQDKVSYESMKKKLTEELKKEFKPEFLNRIDDIIIFKALSKETLIKIVAVLFDELQDRLKEKNIKIRTTKQVQAFLVDKGYEPKKGARPLKRAIQHYFEDKLADKLLEQNLKTNLDVSATLKKGAISFNIKPL